MANNTVTVEATTVDTTTVDTSVETAETTPVEISAPSQSAIGQINKLADAHRGAYISLCAATGELVRQPFTAKTYLEMAEIIADLETTNQIELKFGLTDTEAKAYAGIARHYFAASAVQALDASHHGMRLTTLGEGDGIGVYAEAGPLGHAGLGVGFVSRETVDGVTTVKHSGVGVYLRADHAIEKGKLVQSFA
jgi:hypothetical protein